MSSHVSWMLELSINEGQFENFEALMNEMVEATRADEPNAIVYEWFISEDKATSHIYERYSDAASVMAHMSSFGAKYAARFMSCVTPGKITIYGDPGDEVKAAMAALSPVYMGTFGGFAR